MILRNRLKYNIYKGGDIMRFRITDLRIDRDLNQTQVAEYLNMSQTGYSKYETGERDIPTLIWIKLSTFYNTSVDYLMGLTDKKRPYPRTKY